MSINISVSGLNEITFLSRLNRKHIECEIEELNDELEIFGRVKRVLRKGQVLKLYNLSGNVILPQTAIQGLIAGFANQPDAKEILGITGPLTMKKFEIHYPAIEIDPVTIYW